MPIDVKEVKSSPVDKEKCEEVEAKILAIINESKLNLRELIVILGLTMMDLGGSLSGKTELPAIEDAWRAYGEDPTFGNSLLALGADLLHHWAAFVSIPKEDK